MSTITTKKVAPDGGYGWVIVLANALSNFITIPLMHCFGLIFKDTFTELNFSATQGSVIINLNGAFGMMTGLISGVLLKVYGCRKVALVAAFLLTLGVVLTAFADTFTYFIVTYGLITSLGIGMSQSACNLAVISYFTSKRSKAMGMAVTITGFGPILIPQIIRLLMKFYTAEGTTFIFGGICTHVFIAATLLQPVEWHMKTEAVIDEEMQLKPTEDAEEEQDNLTPLNNPRITKQISICSHNSQQEENEIAALGVESEINGSILSLNSVALSRKNSVISRTKTNAINKECEEHKKVVVEEENLPVFRRISRNIGKMFDFDLLDDRIFVNIMMGMALAIFAEFNFNLLTPFILRDFGLTTDEIAFFLSVLGVTDIIFRFLAPYLGELFKKPPRLMYAFSLILLIITRFTFILSTDYYVLLFVSLGLGLAKGIRKVYMALVIPAHVPLEKLASASGMEMMMNGFCIIIGGPILGLVRDLTGSYVYCVIIMNCVTFTTILMWTAEAVLVRYKKRNSIPETNL